MSVATPVKAWVASLNAGGFISHGQSLTVTINITGGWEIQIPTGVRYGSNVSLASAIFAYPSNDGGATYDTEPVAAMSIPVTASVNKVASLRLTTGQYAIQIQSSSPSTTFYVLTQEIISAFNIA
jgi:hypothetical protein